MQIALLCFLYLPLLTEHPFSPRCFFDVVTINFLLRLHDSATQLLESQVFPQIDYGCPAFINRFVDSCNIVANLLNVVGQELDFLLI